VSASPWWAPRSSLPACQAPDAVPQPTPARLGRPRRAPPPPPLAAPPLPAGRRPRGGVGILPPGRGGGGGAGGGGRGGGGGGTGVVVVAGMRGTLGRSTNGDVPDCTPDWELLVAEEARNLVPLKPTPAANEARAALDGVQSMVAPFSNTVPGGIGERTNELDALAPISGTASLTRGPPRTATADTPAPSCAETSTSGGPGTPVAPIGPAPPTTPAPTALAATTPPAGAPCPASPHPRAGNKGAGVLAFRSERGLAARAASAAVAVAAVEAAEAAAASFRRRFSENARKTSEMRLFF